LRGIAIDRTGLAALPDGAMLYQGDRSFAKRRGRLRAWTFRGWTDAVDFSDPSVAGVRLLTPPSTVAALAAGYGPAWHPTAGTVG
jgi:hypothetical protein